METTSYVALTRQSGLLQEMQAVANNIANANTVGYRREGVVFSEFVQFAADAPSLSMATARVGVVSAEPGGLSSTGGAFDLAIVGDGFFRVETPAGERLTRDGRFHPDANGDLVDLQGNRVLDAGGAPVSIPTGAGEVQVGADGTISTAGGPLAKIGIHTVAEPQHLRRESGGLFRSDDATYPVEDPDIRQGFIEQSNVNPVSELARMIEVQRSYEAGQKLLDHEDERIRSVIRTLGQNV